MDISSGLNVLVNGKQRKNNGTCVKKAGFSFKKNVNCARFSDDLANIAHFLESD